MKMDGSEVWKVKVQQNKRKFDSFIKLHRLILSLHKDLVFYGMK